MAKIVVTSCAIKSVGFIKLALLVFFALPGQALAKPKTFSAPMVIRISLVTGAPIRYPSMSEVKVRFENRSNEPIIFDPHAVAPEGPFHIVDQQSKPVSRIPLPTKTYPDGSILVYIGMGRSNPIQLDPGKSIETNISLNRKYDLRKPGTYKMSLERKFGNVTVRSNEIEFRVGVPLEPWEIERQDREFKEKR